MSSEWQLDVPLSENSLDGLRRFGFSKPLPVQIGALVISPTAQLAIQLFEVLTKLLDSFCDAENKPLFTTLVCTGRGGLDGVTNKMKDLENFESKGATILIATPGRLVDTAHYGAQSSVNPIVRGLRSLEVLILDEADRLLEMGFETQLNILLGLLPKQRRTGLFSATQTTQVEDLLRAGLRNPVRVVVKEQDLSVKPTNKRKKTIEAINQRTPMSLTNYFMVVQADVKLSCVLRFILSHANEKLLIFLATCACVDYFSRVLRQLLPNRQAKRVYALHGKLRQTRTSVFNTFRSETAAVLLCTDVMARGVDIPQVTWVLQCDPPTSATAFVHRCGRTARCGANGQALLFLTEKELAYVNFLKINQEVSLTEMNLTEFDSLCASAIQSPANTPEEVTRRVRQCCKRDKLIHEKSVRAYVSYVQFYRKHECHLLLKWKELDLGRLGNGFGLLRLPGMPEMRNADTSAFTPCNVDIKKLKYREKSVAKQREIMAADETNVKPKYSIKNKPWSRSKDAKLRKQEGYKKKKTKTSRPVSSVSAASKTLVAEPMDEKEIDELSEDYRMLKRGRKRKMSEVVLECD